jgi:hypothetical protein
MHEFWTDLRIVAETILYATIPAQNVNYVCAFLFECFAKCSTCLVDENPACVNHASH